jgi:hypothetical protein
MNKRIAAAVTMAVSILLGPAALAAPVAPGYDLESVGDGVLDHGRGEQGDDDHDHDGDGRQDHDPEDHDDDDRGKPKDDDA